MGEVCRVDWAADKHDVLVADEAGEELLAATFAHDEAGLSALCRELVRLEVELVAIERPDGLLVERLLDAGLRVLAMHPNQVAAARDGSGSRAASPIGLTRSCCASWRAPIITASGCSSPTAIRPRRCGRSPARGRISSQRASRWATSCAPSWSGSGPARSGCSAELDSPIALAFLERYPSPVDARGLGEKRLAAFLARQHYSGGRKPDAAAGKLAARARGRAGELEIDARRAARARAWSRRSAAGRADQAARARDRARGPRASRRPDLPLAVPRPRQRRSPPPSCWRRSATAASATPPRRARRRRRPSRRRRRIRQTQDRLLPLRLQQATARRVLHAGRHHPPLAPLGRRPLRRSARPRPRPPPRASAPSDAPGAASCGAAGTTTPPTTPRATAPCNDTSPSPSPHRRAPCPTSLPPSGCSAPPSPNGRPAGPSAQRLTASRHPLPRHGVDTGRLWRRSSTLTVPTPACALPRTRASAWTRPTLAFVISVPWARSGRLHWPHRGRAHGRGARNQRIARREPASRRSGTGAVSGARFSRKAQVRASGLRYRRSCNRASAGLHADNGTLRRPHQMRPQLGDSAGRRSATNREQRCVALGAVALPAGTTVGQGHLPRVGDGDLLAADASALWLGFRCLWLSCARFNHGPGSIFPADWLSRGRCQSTRADLRSEHPLARLVGGLGLVRIVGQLS